MALSQQEQSLYRDARSQGATREDAEEILQQFRANQPAEPAVDVSFSPVSTEPSAFQVGEGRGLLDRAQGAIAGFQEAGAGIQERTAELKEREVEVSPFVKKFVDPLDTGFASGKALEAGSIAAGGAASLVGGVIGGFLSPELEGIATTAIENAPDELKEKTAAAFKKADEVYQGLPPAAQNALFGSQGFVELLTGEVLGKVGSQVVKQTKKAAQVVREVPQVVKQKVDQFSQARQAGKNKKEIDHIESSVDEFIGKNRAFAKAEKSPKFKNTDLRTPLKDREVFSGLRVEDGKLNPDEAILTLQDRLDQAMNSKRSLLPVADQRLPDIKKQDIRESAIENMRSLSPLGDKKLIERIDAELAEFPDSINHTQADQLRARFRNSAVDARGVQKSDTEFAAIENGLRELIFKSIDTLPGGEGKAATLNKYIKDTLNTIEFLDKNLRSHIVKSGRLSKLFAQNIGAVAGSAGGVLGSVTGGLAGGIVSDILSNRALGNTIKRQMLLDLTDGSPQAVKAVDEMLRDLPDQLALPAPRGDVRSEIGSGQPILLQKEAPSTIEARDIERLSTPSKTGRFKGTRGAIGSDVNQSLSKPATAQKSLTEQAKEFDTAEDFIKSKAKLFHGTDKEFDKFDLDKSQGGGIWFTNRKDFIEEGLVGASAKGRIIETNLDESGLKFGDFDDADKFSTQELIDNGFDGLKLVEDGEVTYSLFTKKGLDSIKSNKELKDIFNQAKSKPATAQTNIDKSLQQSNTLDDFVGKLSIEERSFIQKKHNTGFPSAIKKEFEAKKSNITKAPENAKDFTKDIPTDNPELIKLARKSQDKDEFISTMRNVHRPPNADPELRLDDLTLPYGGEDIYSPNGLRFFGQGFKGDDKAIQVIKSSRNNPEKVVEMYRAIGKGESESIKAGDWVTMTKEYAQLHIDHSLDGKGKILKQKAKVKDLYNDGNSLQEFGYRPNNHKDLNRKELGELFDRAKSSQ